MPSGGNFVDENGGSSEFYQVLKGHFMKGDRFFSDVKDWSSSVVMEALSEGEGAFFLGWIVVSFTEAGGKNSGTLVQSSQFRAGFPAQIAPTYVTCHMP